MEFFNLLIHNDLRDASILIFANKMDLPTAKNPAQLTEAYNLHEIKHHDWHIQSCCALTGEGLKEGLDWLTTKLCQRHKVKKSEADGGLKYVTKLPEHDRVAKLTDLTIGDRDRDEEEKV